MIPPELARIIEATTRAAGPDWRTRADAVVAKLAETRFEFTVDDVWGAGLTKPREPRALGGVMTSAKRDGLIERTSRYVPSTNPICHRNPKVVWRSNVFGKVAA